MAVSQVYVSLISGILCFFSFGRLKINVRHVAVVTKRFPPNVFLVVAHIEAMYVVACVLALDGVRLAMA